MEAPLWTWSHRPKVSVRARASEAAKLHSAMPMALSIAAAKRTYKHACAQRHAFYKPVEKGSTHL